MNCARRGGALLLFHNVLLVRGCLLREDESWEADILGLAEGTEGAYVAGGGDVRDVGLGGAGRIVGRNREANICCLA